MASNVHPYHTMNDNNRVVLRRDVSILIQSLIEILMYRDKLIIEFTCSCGELS